MIDKRPIHLDLTTLKFPLTAIISILHRLSGIALFVFFPFFLYLLNLSLRSDIDFKVVISYLQTDWVKGMLWLFLLAFWYHLLAGIRHGCMDLGWGESLKAARLSGMLMLCGFGIGAIGLGVWLWA